MTFFAHCPVPIKPWPSFDWVIRTRRRRLLREAEQWTSQTKPAGDTGKMHFIAVSAVEEANSLIMASPTVIQLHEVNDECIESRLRHASTRRTSDDPMITSAPDSLTAVCQRRDGVGAIDGAMPSRRHMMEATQQQRAG